jgi:dihydroorotate dehydrogenase
MGLILRGIDFNRAWCASGAMNFFFDGYPFHRWLKPFGLAPDFRGATFVAKTTTLELRAGNLPLNYTRPREIRPRCIRVNFRWGAVLNAVGLSGPGLEALLADGRWQYRLDPFLLSFMAVDDDLTTRYARVRQAAERLAAAQHRFLTPFGIEVNLSCPNVGLDPAPLVRSAASILSIFRSCLPDVPLVPKLSVLVPPSVARQIATHAPCDAVCCSNTIPWGALPDRIDWRGLFGAVSPLARYGGGGLSGAPLTPLVREWLTSAVGSGFPVPLVAGGGVMTPADAVALLDLGAGAVEIGSVAILRPWRVGRIIQAIQVWDKENTCKK